MELDDILVEAEGVDLDLAASEDGGVGVGGVGIWVGV